MTKNAAPDVRSFQPLLRLAPYALKYRGLALMALFSLLLASGATLSLPTFIRGLVDQGLSQGDVGFVDQYAGWLLLVVVVLALGSALRYYFVIVLGERVVNDLRQDVFAKLTKLSPHFYDQARSGELVSRLTADATQIKSAVGASASMALRNFLLFVGAAVMMVITSASMSAMVLGALPLVVLPLVALGRWVRGRQRFAQDRLADSSAFATEAIGSMRILQAFGQEARVVRFFSDRIEEAFGAARASIQARAVLTAFAIFVIFSSIVGVLWYAAQDVAAGNLSAGALSQFVLYSVLAAAGLGGMSEVWGEVSQASGSAERLFELLDEEILIQSPDHGTLLTRDQRLDIAFDGVGFAYPGQPEKLIFKDLSFSIKAGETVAIVGPSGAGKSTLFQLLMRFYDLNEGQISIGGEAVSGVDLASLRAAMALVPQEPVVFAMSVAQNIAMGWQEASADERERAAKAAHAHEFIIQLAQGYETEVGERGVMLSGGQRQRLAIARAILKDAPILLLDEATSALDAESEGLVQEALDGLMVDRTTLVIAHRLATVKRADRILVLDKGRLVEEGTHEELIARGGLYARLARLQFGFEGREREDDVEQLS